MATDGGCARYRVLDTALLRVQRKLEGKIGRKERPTRRDMLEDTQVMIYSGKKSRAKHASQLGCLIKEVSPGGQGKATSLALLSRLTAAAAQPPPWRLAARRRWQRTAGAATAAPWRLSSRLAPAWWPGTATVSLGRACCGLIEWERGGEGRPDQPCRSLPP